jgi:antitoxin component of MazEF toxin-antitoxin module
MEETDEFFGKVTKIGGSLGIIIPNRNVEFSGLKEGDYLKVYYKKRTPVEEEE